MSDPIEIANDIKAAIAELADGRSFPDLLEAVDSLAALAQTGQAVDKESLTAEAAPAGEVAKSLLRKPLKAGERMVCYCPPGICQAPKGFSGPCNRAAPATEPAAPGYVSAPSPVEDKDGARFNWFFGPADKISFMPTYMEGMHKGWTPDEWRDAIDQALAQEGAHR